MNFKTGPETLKSEAGVTNIHPLPSLGKEATL